MERVWFAAPPVVLLPVAETVELTDAVLLVDWEAEAVGVEIDAEVLLVVVS